MSAKKIPSIILNNGQRMPQIGLGTWNTRNGKGEVENAVKTAIEIGYRHIDCAHIYQNELEVGAAIKNIAKTVKREEVFITSKLWNTFHAADLVESACSESLKNLGLKYLDMYLMHWPMGYKAGNDLLARGKDGKTQFSNVDYLETWRAMENLVHCGLTKSIGVSNFNNKQLQRLMKKANIPPANLQIECHPYLNQSSLMGFCKCYDIAVTAYSPLGSPGRPGIKTTELVLMNDPLLKTIAEQHCKAVSQVLIRFQLQRGNIVIPKSVNKERIASNFNVFDFHLTDDDMITLNAINKNYRYVGMKGVYGHPHHPFEKEED